MTPAAELWAAVVKQCATGRGYRIEADNWGLKLERHGGHVVVVRQCMDRWTAGVRFTDLTEYITADEAVRAALRIVAPSTEPNVSC